jgi:hypothetical protein
MRKILFLFLGLVFVHCETIKDKFETKIGYTTHQRKFDSDI